MTDKQSTPEVIPPDQGLRIAKRMLRDIARDPDSEWRTGYIQALTMFLLEAYSVGAAFVPATYRFDDEEPEAKP
jgi:hypothetical protein